MWLLVVPQKGDGPDTALSDEPLCEGKLRRIYADAKVEPLDASTAGCARAFDPRRFGEAYKNCAGAIFIKSVTRTWFPRSLTLGPTPMVSGGPGS